MDQITATLKPGAKGTKVANLQDGLRLILERKAIRASDALTAEELNRLDMQLSTERAQSTYGEATQDLVRHFQLQEGLGDGLGGAVEKKTAARLNEVLKQLGAFDEVPDWVVRGTVRDLNGTALPGIFVLALDRDLRPQRSQALSELVMTDEHGAYETRYPAGRFAAAEAGGPDLQVQVFDSAERKVLLATSPVHFNAGADTTIDVSTQVVAEQPSEFDSLLAKVLPLLTGQRDDGHDLTVAELEPADIEFIASDTGIEQQQIAWLREAHRTGAELEHEFGAACCYGFFRLGMPTDPAALWATAAPNLVQALQDAIRRQIVAARVGDVIDVIEAAIRHRQAARALKAPRFGGGSAAASLVDMLALLPTPPGLESQLALADAADALRHDDPKLVERIAAIRGLADTAQSVARVLRLGVLTEGNVPLARALLLRLADDGEADGALKPLAALRPDEWIDLAHAHGVPGGVGMAPAVYAGELSARIERANPTAALAVHLEERRLGRQPVLNDAGLFLRNNPAFDIGTANVRLPGDQFNVDGVERPQELFAALRGLQHMQKLGARWEETAALYEYGLTSPHRLLMEGPTQVNRLLDGQVSPDRVNELCGRARDLCATTIGAFTAALSPLSGPKALPGGFTLEGDPVPPEPGGGELDRDPREETGRWLRERGIPRDLIIAPRIPKVQQDRPPRKQPHLPDSIREIVDRDPTLQSLFGQQDSCSCEQCLSVLSQGAYFVDVLQFLRDAGYLGNLFARRPDLQDLELTCENTDTPVPSIDLALEILENAVALPLPVSLGADVDAEAELSGGTVGPSVRAALERTVRELKGTVTAKRSGSIEAGTGDWTVVDGHRRWTLTLQKRFRALTDAGAKLPLETAGLNEPAILAALNLGQLGTGLDSAFAALLGTSVKGPHDLSNYAFTITPIAADRSWRVGYRCVAELEIDVAQRTLILRTTAGADWLQRRYDALTIDAVKTELDDRQVAALLAMVLEERFPGARRFTFAKAGTNRWSVASADRTLTLSYTPVGLTISSLAYQSGDTTVDALAGPENHNPAAYALLNAPRVSFPWTLPVDLPLEEVRLYLDRARSSRRALMEAMRPVTQTGASASDVREVLGLSEAEAGLIAPGSAPTVDRTLANWGLTANRTRIRDAAAGADATADDAPGLLKIVSILLQQSRLSFDELESVLATTFVRAQTAPLDIAYRETCVPSDMRIAALTPDHLERIHRFVRLQRRLRWSIADLDTAIRVCTSGVLDATALTKLADLVRLAETLDLKPGKVLAWWSEAAADGRAKREGELARALPVTTAELTHAAALFGFTDAFASPSDTLRLCERMAPIRRRGISFEDLRYILRHDTAPPSDVELTDALRDALVTAARDAVRSIPETAAATQALELATPVGGRAAEAVVAALANRLGTGRELVDDLLRTRLRHPTTATQAAISVFLDNAFFVPGQPPPLADSIRTVIVRLHKSVALCTALRFEAADLRLLRRMFPAPEDTGLTGLEFDALPAAATSAPVPMGGFEQLLAILDIRDLAQGTAALLRQYAALNFTDIARARKVLAASLARSAKPDDDEEHVLHAANQLQITTPAQYRDPVALQRLMKLLLTLEQLGAKVSDAQACTADSPTDAQSQRAREILQSKFSQATWREVGKPIADKLRERQRDALVDYLVARDNLRDADDLYEKYLIDVQMGSCLTATRLLAAISAAQLFVQRCMLNLEGYAISPEKRDLWGWMHRYRVWEANRKVFLFPENWLLPELRDDKTAIFRQLEGAMAEQEPSLQSTREALIGYLEELGELGQITAVALYVHTQQVEASKDRTLYVVGRIPDQSKYYWRSCSHFGDPRTMFWSGWEALELDNANDYLMPFVFEGDLHVAWPTFRSTTDEVTTDANAERKWEVKLAWVRRSARGWTKRKLGKQVMLTRRLINKTPEQSFTFRLSHSAVSGALDPVPIGAIQIACYAAKEIDTKHEAVVETSRTEYATKAELEPNDSRGLNWPDSWVDITCIVKGKFKPQNEQQDLYVDVSNATLTLVYWAHPRGSDDKVPFGATPVKQPPRVFYADQIGRPIGLWVASGTEISATFKLPGSNDVNPLPPVLVQRDNGRFEAYWTLKYTAVFDLKALPDGLLAQQRQVKYEHAGAFSLDSLHDLSIAPPSMAGEPPAPERLPLMFDGPPFTDRATIGVVGNGFSFGAVGSDLPVPANGHTTIDRGPLSKVTIIPAGPFGLTASSLPAYPVAPLVLYISDAKRRFFVSIDSTSRIASPDGHAFVGLYRQRTAAATFSIFERNIQSWPLDDLDAARPANALRTVNSAISFQRSDTYANYNWELFLHVPLAVSDYLARQQRFEDARRWLHAVFDPTAEWSPIEGSSFWKFLPLADAGRPEAIVKLLTWLVDPNAGDPEVEAGLSGQIDEWKRNPFMPHLVARLRPSAYQWYAFFAYVELLIGWGDQLFRRDTRESVNEATLLYVLAARLLGPRPRDIPVDHAKPPQTYRSLPKDSNGNLAQFSEAWLGLVDQPGLANVFLEAPGTAVARRPVFAAAGNGTIVVGAEGAQPSAGTEILASLGSLAFCIPRNSKIDELHDLVGGRLWNIRHCRNIEGVPRELPVWDPPIDPLLLIKAKAAGLDLNTVLASYPPATPHYRFATVLQKAKELAAEVKSLGAAMLAALEKRDAEEMALLRSRHEVAMLTLVRDTRQRQIDEAGGAIVALEQSQETVRERFNQYQRLLGKNSATKGQDGLPVVEQGSMLSVSNDAGGAASGLGLVNKEIQQLGLTKEAKDFTLVANVLHVIAGVAHAVPNFTIGAAGTYQTTFGGSNVGSALDAVAKGFEAVVSDKSLGANQAGALAGYERRQDEWVHQSKLALAELKQLDKQILAAQIRKDIAQKELESHELQIENTKEVDDFFHDKFTSKDLYRWMSARLAEAYFRGYQLAVDVAQRAETAFQHELPLPSGAATTSFVQKGSWDSLKKGLLAAEQLALDLQRMEASYLDQNKRDYEITKHISIAQLDPVALILLKETGTCSISIPEVLFDLDYPGHFFRRLKSVALSIPCVAGPYVGVNCKLTLTRHAYRKDAVVGNDEKYEVNPFADSPDKHFVSVRDVQEAMVTSNAQNDTGMFETNLRDERYLPFEGAGAISEWKLELPDQLRAFDYDSIADAILHLRFTARDGGKDLKRMAGESLVHALNAIVDSGAEKGLSRVFSLRHEFATEWYRFVNPTAPVGDLTMTVPLAKDRFPSIFRDPRVNLTLSSLQVWAALKQSYLADHAVETIKLSLAAGSVDSTGGMTLTVGERLLKGEEVLTTGVPSTWTLAGWLREDPAMPDHSGLDPNALEDILLVCRYTVSVPKST